MVGPAGVTAPPVRLAGVGCHPGVVLPVELQRHPGTGVAEGLVPDAEGQRGARGPVGQPVPPGLGNGAGVVAAVVPEQVVGDVDGPAARGGAVATALDLEEGLAFLDSRIPRRAPPTRLAGLGPG